MSSLFSIGGLASGLDTNSIVDQLISLERLPIGRLESRKTTEKGEIDALSALTTKLSGVRSALSKLDGTLDWRAFRTATSDDEDVATVVANNGAQPQTIGFTVLALARTHQVRDAQAYADGDTLYGDGTLTVTLDDGTIHDVDTTALTVAEVRQAIDDLDGVRASIVGLTDGDHLVITSEDSGEAGQFTVSFTGANTFATVTAGQDARIDLDGDGGTTDDQAVSSSNSFTSFLQNTTITVKSLGSTTVTIDNDVTAAADQVESLVTSMNDLFTAAGELTKFGGEDGANGPLIGNAMVRDLVGQLRTTITQIVQDADAQFRTAGSIGISLDRDGGVTVDRSALEDALRADFDGVRDLFLDGDDVPAITTRDGSSDNTNVAFSALTTDTQDGTYAVTVDSVYHQAQLLSGTHTITSSEAKAGYDVTIDGVTHELRIRFEDDKGYEPYTGGNNTRATDPAEALQIWQDFFAAEFSGHSYTIENVAANPTTDFQLRITDDDNAGAISIALSRDDDVLSLAGASDTSTTLAVTIDGQAASVSGNTVTSTSGPSLGLELTIDAGTTAGETANVTVTTTTTPPISGDPGLSGLLDAVIDAFEGVDGRIQGEKDLRQSAIDLYDDRIEALERRIELREIALTRQFTAMETALSMMQQQLAAFLGQLGSLPTNLNQ